MAGLTRTVSLLVIAVMLGRIAWIGDDSLITLRTVLNISHGWGFGFNALESVQGYTHPLWMLTWLAVGSLSGSWTISIIGISLLFSTLAFFLVLRLTRNVMLIILASVLILGSNAISEYSSSGLENPLAFFLTMGLFTILWRVGYSPLIAVATGFVASLILLTRLDLIVLIAPPIVFWFLTGRQQLISRLTRFMIGFAPPLVSWFCFSWIVYGSILPNTFLAKRNVSISSTELIEQGLFYVAFSLRHDVITGLVLALSIVLPAITRSPQLLAWSLGILAYTMYAVQNGGDFMAYRFLSVPAVIGLATISLALERILDGRDLRKSSRLIMGAAPLISGLLIISPPTTLRPDLSRERWSFSDDEVRGIADERAFYDARGMTAWDFFGDPNLFEDAETIGEVEREADSWPKSDGSRVNSPATQVVCGGLGMVGINSGPTTHVIDPCGLTDRFLAETEFESQGGQWRIGHFQRELPDGYEQAILNSDPSFLVDPREEERLRDLWKVIRD